MIIHSIKIFFFSSSSSFKPINASEILSSIGSLISSFVILNINFHLIINFFNFFLIIIRNKSSWLQPVLNVTSTLNNFQPYMKIIYDNIILANPMRYFFIDIIILSYTINIDCNSFWSHQWMTCLLKQERFKISSQSLEDCR